jgi:hypothetical protein
MRIDRCAVQLFRLLIALRLPLNAPLASFLQRVHRSPSCRLCRERGRHAPKRPPRPRYPIQSAIFSAARRQNAACRAPAEAGACPLGERARRKFRCPEMAVANVREFGTSRVRSASIVLALQRPAGFRRVMDDRASRPSISRQIARTYRAGIANSNRFDPSMRIAPDVMRRVRWH